MSKEDTDLDIKPLNDNESIANRVKLSHSPTKGATSISAESRKTPSIAQRVRPWKNDTTKNGKTIKDFFSKKRGRKRKVFKSKVKKS